MTPRGGITVAVASRGRPWALARCLAALSRHDGPRFELVVVGQTVTPPAAPAGMTLRYLRCGEANVARARNLALAAATGAVIAFLDDDALPLPGWLDRLAAPFADPAVAAAGGLVRRPDGAAEFAGAVLDRAGRRVGRPPRGPRVAPPCPGRQLAPMGANCAFRTAALRALGGFDPRYRYFREETDAAFRLAGAGGHVAWVPGAAVVHARLPNAQREAAGLPRDPFEIAASWAVFCAIHAPGAEGEAALADFAARRRARHARLAAQGRIAGAEAARLDARIRAGLAAGAARLALAGRTHPAQPRPRGVRDVFPTGGIGPALDAVPVP